MEGRFEFSQIPQQLVFLVISTVQNPRTSPTHNKPKFNNLIRKFQAQLQQLCQTDTVEDEIKENSPGNWENQLHENIKIATVIVPNCEGDINR